MSLAKKEATSLCSRNTKTFLFFNCFKKLILKSISQSGLDSNFYTNKLKPLSFAFNFCYHIVFSSLAHKILVNCNLSFESRIFIKFWFAKKF